MTLEEKAKAYDEALEKAKAYINSKGIGDTVDLCKHLFPELCESEDEKIMITEDYVSFETAQLLKEKGFDIDECEVHYDPLDHTQYDITLQMAMKWLREEHRIFISICPELNEELIDGNHTGMYQEMLYSFNVGQWGESGWHDIPESSNYIEYHTYEAACEAAIKYCLENLI